MIPSPPFPWELSPELEAREFEHLKLRLVGLWHDVFARRDQPYTSVVVPSVSLDPRSCAKRIPMGDCHKLPQRLPGGKTAEDYFSLTDEPGQPYQGAELDKVVQQNAANAEQSAAAAQQLNAQAYLVSSSVQEMVTIVGGDGSGTGGYSSDQSAIAQQDSAGILSSTKDNRLIQAHGI